MQVKVVLTGPSSGKTVLIHGKQFVNGVMVVSFTTPAEKEFQLRYLSRVCRAYLAGSSELADAQLKDKERGIQCEVHSSPEQRHTEAVLSGAVATTGAVSEVPNLLGGGLDPDESTDGDQGLGSAGSGHSDSGLHPEQVAAIRKAVRSLDPLTESHWTQGGLPTVESVCAVMQDKGITRAMIQAVEPEFNRELSLKMAAENEI